MLTRLRAWTLLVPLGLAGCSAGAVTPRDDGAFDASAPTDAGSDTSVAFDLGANDASADTGFGWDSSSFGDAGGDAGVIVGPVLRVLTPTVGSYTTLVQGELLVVEARVEDALGAPLANERVDFALLGDPKDSSLSGFFASTDAEGRVQVFVLGGQVATTFTLRVTGPSGQPVYATVEVAPMPTIDFTVSLSAEAAAALTPLGVFAFADRTCDSVFGVPPSQAGVFAPAATSATIALPQGVDYALVVEADDGLSIVRDCVDGVDPTTLSSTTVDFGFAP